MMTKGESELVVVVRLPPAAPDAAVTEADGSDHKKGPVVPGPVGDPHGGADGAGDSTSDGGGSERTRKKTTYDHRKEQIATMRNEIETLQRRLRHLQDVDERTSVRGLKRAMEYTSDLQRTRKSRERAIAVSESMISQYKMTRALNPLETFIHLPKEHPARMDVLHGLYDEKIKEATSFMLDRFQHIDLRRHHRQSESFEQPNGDFVVITCDVTPFEGRHGVKQVFDEFLFFVRNQEISVSETLGVITVRESDDEVDRPPSQCRLVSTLAPGVELEVNAARFFKYVEKPGDSDPPGLAPYAISTIDYVNQDDLHPYHPNRIRRDMTASVLVRRCLTPPDAPPIVSMTRWVWIRMRAPKFPIPKPIERLARDCMEQWETVMPKVMQERLAGR